MGNTMFGLSLIDWIVIVGYLLGITALGMWAIRRVRSAASFFISDRKFGKLLMMFFTFGTGTHSDQAVIVASKTYTSGASGIWCQWLLNAPRILFGTVAMLLGLFTACSSKQSNVDSGASPEDQIISIGTLVFF